MLRASRTSPLLAALPLLLAAAPAEGTFCADPGPYVIEIDSLPGDSITSVVCGGTGFFCKRPKTNGPSVQLADPSCDPSLGPCTVVIRVPLEFPGRSRTSPRAARTSAR